MLVTAALVAGGISAWSAVGASRRTSRASPDHRAPAPAAIPAWSLVARLRADTPGYLRPGETESETVIPATWAGGVSALPVVREERGWLEVRLVALPPHPPTAWVPSGRVDLVRTPYHLVVGLSARRVLLYREGRLDLCAPAAVGAPGTPTPAGRYFVASLVRSPGAGYGPFVLVTSALPGQVADWEEAGAPVVTIAGPLGSDAALGQGGGAVTTGGIRLQDRDLARLRVVPVGSEVDVAPGLPAPLSAHDRARCGLAVPRHGAHRELTR